MRRICAIIYTTIRFGGHVMSAQKEDLRIVRTRKLLSNKLLDMMEEESIEKSAS